MCDRLAQLTTNLAALHDQLRHRAGRSRDGAAADSLPNPDPRIYSCLLATHLLTEHAGDLMPRAVANSVAAAQALVGEMQLAPKAVVDARAPLLAGLKGYLESLLARCDDTAEGSARGDFSGLADEPLVGRLVAACRSLTVIRGADLQTAVQQQAMGQLVLLLLSSRSRRSILRDRLAAIGLRTELLGSAMEAWRRCQQRPRPTAILCDNRAPTRHLQSLGQLQARHARRALPALVLVASGRRVAVQRQARVLRATGAWTFPYALVDLIEILASD